MRAAHIRACEEDAVRRRAGGKETERFGIIDAKRLLAVNTSDVGDVTEERGKLRLKEDSVFKSYRWPPLRLLTHGHRDEMLVIIKRAIVEHFVLRKFGKKFRRLRGAAALERWREQAAKTGPVGRRRKKGRRKSYTDALARWLPEGFEPPRLSVQKASRKSRALREAVKKAVGRETTSGEGIASVAAVALAAAKGADEPAQASGFADYLGYGESERPTTRPDTTFSRASDLSDIGEQPETADAPPQASLLGGLATRHMHAGRLAMRAADVFASPVAAVDPTWSDLGRKMKRQDVLKRHFRAAKDDVVTANNLLAGAKGRRKITRDLAKPRATARGSESSAAKLARAHGNANLAQLSRRAVT